MKFKFHRYDVEGDSTDHIDLASGDSEYDQPPDWVELELTNRLVLATIRGLTVSSEIVHSVSTREGFTICDVDPEWGNWVSPRLTMYRHGSGYGVYASVSFYSKHASLETEVDISDMLIAYLDHKEYKPYYMVEIKEVVNDTNA
jgi:hypothetical protein